ncbi:MAG: 3-isopropylmalate dehydratase large subunit [Smithella sp.]|nr:3-isopropylmalate dehydratase large subunit [Smithella sp.]
MNSSLTLVDKIWYDHVIMNLDNDIDLMFIDRNFQHEMSGSVSLKCIQNTKRKIRNINLSFGTLDHVLDTRPGRTDATMIPGGTEFIKEFRALTKSYKIPLFDIDNPDQGIVHVIAPDLGIALPGCTFACGDSHTCTVGGIGALAWGIGATDAEHVFATQSLVQVKPKNMRVTFKGTRGKGVSAKDLVLYLISKAGADAGIDHAVEYAGPVIESLTIDERLTMCNMAIEFSARTGIVAPDDVTFNYLHDKPYAPKGKVWDDAVAYWRTLPSDPEAKFDKELFYDCENVRPQVTWGTSPTHSVAVDDVVPDPIKAPDSAIRLTMQRALDYIGLTPGTRMEDIKIDAAFIGSCTNGRLSDLREAARILKGRKVAPGIKAICSPGSSQTKRMAESEGISKIFQEAGFEWREPGCSFCMSGGAGGEGFEYGQRVLSTTNRNFEDRQGRGVRSHLASPATVAASAILGHIADPRKFGE